MEKTSREQLQEVLDKNHSCYVLVTCGEPSEDGKMQVEMTYQGDPSLAAYLLEDAQSLIHQEVSQEDFSIPSIHLIKS